MLFYSFKFEIRANQHFISQLLPCQQPCVNADGQALITALSYQPHHSSGAHLLDLAASTPIPEDDKAPQLSTWHFPALSCPALAYPWAEAALGQLLQYSVSFLKDFQRDLSEQC